MEILDINKLIKVVKESNNIPDRFIDITNFLILKLFL